METYRTEEEQVEAIRRWWDENGRSTILAIVVAVAAGFGWQAWKGYDQQSVENASNIYQALVQSIDVEQRTPQSKAATLDLAEQLKAEYAASSYAQFAALHLASLAVAESDLGEAERQLRWVLSKADKGGDVAQVTELRLARVLAASGQADQALEILRRAGNGGYAASYAIARGDVLLQLGKKEEARDAYNDAKTLAGADAGQINLATLEQKLQSLNAQPAREIVAVSEEQSADTMVDIIEPATALEEK
ncbi:MAG: tetratricopeptide repeat protein [Halioglobus sp.]